MKAIVVILLTSLVMAGCSQTKEDTSSNEKTEGLNFAKDFIVRAGQSWNLESVIGDFDPAINASNNRNDFEAIFSLYRKSLGKVKEIKEGSVKAFVPRTSNEEMAPDATAQYQVDFSAEKDANARADIVTYKREGKWFIVQINVDSKNIKESISKYADEAIKYASDMVLKISSDWSIDRLKSYVTDDMRKRFESGEGRALVEGFDSLKTKVGAGESIEDTKRGSSTMLNGVYHHINQIKIKCKKGYVTVKISTLNVDGTWKIEAFVYKISKAGKL